MKAQRNETRSSVFRAVGVKPSAERVTLPAAGPRPWAPGFNQNKQGAQWAMEETLGGGQDPSEPPTMLMNENYPESLQAASAVACLATEVSPVLSPAVPAPHRSPTRVFSCKGLTTNNAFILYFFGPQDGT